MKLLLILIFGLLLYSVPAFCISEQDYKNTFETKVMPFYETVAKHDFFDESDSVPMGEKY